MNILIKGALIGFLVFVVLWILSFIIYPFILYPIVFLHMAFGLNLEQNVTYGAIAAAIFLTIIGIAVASLIFLVKTRLVTFYDILAGTPILSFLMIIIIAIYKIINPASPYNANVFAIIFAMFLAIFWAIISVVTLKYSLFTKKKDFKVSILWIFAHLIFVVSVFPFYFKEYREYLKKRQA